MIVCVKGTSGKFHWDTGLPGWVDNSLGGYHQYCKDDCPHFAISMEVMRQLKDMASVMAGDIDFGSAISDLLLKMLGDSA